MSSVFVGRQPIFDRELMVPAVELLFRDPQPPSVGGDDDEMTRRTLVSAVLEIGLESLVDVDQRAFVNVSPTFLREGWYGILPADRTVLELLEHEPITDDTLESIRRARRDGYRVALDDVTFRPDQIRAIPHVDVVKVEIGAVPLDEIAQHIAHIDTSAQWLAEKVEDAETIHRCAELGFDLFQGFFFQKPDLVSAEVPAASQMAQLQLVAELSDDEFDITAVADIVSRDSVLSYKVLRMASSAHFAIPNRVESVRDCVIMLGANAVRRITALLVISTGSKPLALTETALTRARICELAVTSVPISSPGAAYTAGLLSSLDAVIDKPIDQAVSSLPLPSDVKRAIVDSGGSLGRLVQAAIAAERGRTAALGVLLGDDDLADRITTRAAIDARELTDLARGNRAMVGMEHPVA